MSLQGTLRTLGITEVLEFLADRSATGRLDINADSGSATYWMLRGEVANVDYDFEREAGVDAAESTYYALSELDGTFFFDEGEAPEHGTPTESVADVLARTADIAEGWSIVEEQIPSPQHQLVRSNALDGSVTIEPAWWRAIEAIGSGCSSRSLADTLEMRALAASTMAADMARVGLITVDEPVVVEPAAVEPMPADPVDIPDFDTGLVEAEAPVVETASSDLLLSADDASVGFAAAPEVPAADAFAAPEPPMTAEPAPADDEWAVDAPVAPAEAAWDTPAPVEPAAEAAWDTPAPVVEEAPVAAAAPVAEAAPSWDTPPAAEPAADAGWETPAPAAPVAENPAWGAEAPAPAPAPEAAPVVDDDDGWASDHSQPAAANQFPETNDAAAALASWGAVAASAPTPDVPPAAPVAEPVAAAPAPAPAAVDPFADLPSEADLAAPPAPEPAPVMETTPADPGFQAPPTQAAVFATAPPAPAPSPYAPDHAPIPPAPIAPPAGTVEELASLGDLDDVDDEDFGTDDRSSVLKFLRRD